MRARLRRLRRRVVQLAAISFILGLVALAVGSTVTYVAVHQTAQSEFCNSCHIMEPYYESWLNSSHKDVSCIECHYEPGAVETFEGKFKALSQLAKYVTRTQGTKPWAEVSDASCMRSGCHSVRMLEGEVQFGRVKFDHRHHLLESRRGRRLRCVSCHSQIVQGEHVSVTDSVCYMCHFMPLPDGSLPEEASDCETCHGAPVAEVLVNGRSFSHSEYVERGVDCRECHSPVVEGKGVVRTERCHSCHGEVGHIERIGETAFMHEMHVTDHKVECFECHDEIRHGLLPLKSHEPVEGEGCSSCHAGPHGAASLLYAGQGAVGVDDAPSRMYDTRVVCEACHTGRSDLFFEGALAAGDAPGGAAHTFLGWNAPVEKSTPGMVAAAGNLDCVHCHGPGYDGMLEDWQAVVGRQLERIGPMLTELEEQLPVEEDHPALESYWEARQNLELVSNDGSRGAHNVTYALGALEAGAERIDRSFELLGVDREDRAMAGFPFLSKDGCSVCHLGIEDSRSSLANGRPFSHDRHLMSAGLDCATCHSLERHGEPAFPRTDCASCHHAESEERDVFDCAACHGTQASLLEGTLPRLAGQTAIMGELECSDCHGEPPDLALHPSPQLCVICHEEGFDRMQHEWQATVAEQVERLVPVLEELEREAPAGAGTARDLLREARGEIEIVVRDGSRGVHNPGGALGVLRGAAERLDQAREQLAVEDTAPAVAGFPFQSAHGCSTCHLGIERGVSPPDAGSFPHRRHLEAAALDCDACHSVEAHGEPAFDRANCASCHHQESPTLDPWECASCHTQQNAFVLGTLSALMDPPAPMPAPMAEKECTDCHGEPPDLYAPNPAMCVLCHEEGYDELPGTWRASTEELVSKLSAAIEGAGSGVSAAALEQARAALAAVERDGSHGAHNPELVAGLLQEALRVLDGK